MFFFSFPSGKPDLFGVEFITSSLLLFQNEFSRDSLRVRFRSFKLTRYSIRNMHSQFFSHEFSIEAGPFLQPGRYWKQNIVCTCLRSRQKSSLSSQSHNMKAVTSAYRRSDQWLATRPNSHGEFEAAWRFSSNSFAWRENDDRGLGA